MKIVGTSVNKKDLLITSSNIIQNSGYLAVVDWSGKIKYQQHFTNGGVKNLKNFTLNDNNYYSYQLDNGNKSKLEHIYTGNLPSRLIITDSKFNIINFYCNMSKQIIMVNINYFIIMIVTAGTLLNTAKW